MTRVSDDSFMIGPFGDSKKPYDYCETMLKYALLAEGPKQTEIFESSIGLIIDMLVDGITDELAVKNKWSREQGNLADKILLSFVEISRIYVIDTFSEKSLSDNDGTDGPLAFAILFFWTLRDRAYQCVEDNVKTMQTQLSITKQVPPENIS